MLWGNLPSIGVAADKVQGVSGLTCLLPRVQRDHRRTSDGHAHVLQVAARMTACCTGERPMGAESYARPGLAKR